jgi:hypothetical protein
VSLFGIACVEGDCNEGATAVDQLRSFYEETGRPADFQSAFNTIVQRFDEVNGSFTRQIPFSPACCDIKEIGRQAADLMAQIARARSQQGVPTAAPPLNQGLTDDKFKEPGADLEKTMKTLLIVAAVIVGLVLLAPELRKAIGR